MSGVPDVRKPWESRASKQRRTAGIRDELAFVFAVEQIVVALHAGESGPPIGVGHGLQVVELVRIHFAGAQCAYFACFD